MPTIIQFLIPAALVVAGLLVCLAFITLRGFLIAGAVLGVIGGDGWAFQKYGFYGMPTIIYFLIPAAVILGCVLIYLAFTNFRGFLLFGSILAALAAAGWLLNTLAPVVGILLVIWFILRGSAAVPVVVHCSRLSLFIPPFPDISVGEAYMASEADLI